jgi:DNA repair protein RadC
VFKPALIEGSSGIIVSHNHPSGNLTPSDQDRNVTDRLKSAGEILGINVLDHIIHGDETEEMVSLMEDL